MYEYYSDLFTHNKQQFGLYLLLTHDYFCVIITKKLRKKLSFVLFVSIVVDSILIFTSVTKSSAGLRRSACPSERTSKLLACLFRNKA